MAYEKQNFVDGQVLEAEQLNHMEDGIAAAALATEAVSVKPQELTDAQKAQARANIGAAGETVPITASNCFTNPDFNGASGWSVVSGGVLSVSNNKASVSHDGVGTGYQLGITQSMNKDVAPQRTGDKWFIKVHANIDRYYIESSNTWAYPVIQVYVNTASGFFYVVNGAVTEHSSDYYGTFDLTTDAASGMLFGCRVPYNRLGYITGRTCEFSKFVAVNLTETYGAGNEPTADEFYALLGTLDDHFFDGTHTFGDNSVMDAVMEISPVSSDLIVTVGDGGDFDTINAALSHLTKRKPVYKSGGINYEVRILDGTVINEQIWVERNDLSYISITTNNPNNTVQVDVTGWAGVTHDTRGNRPFFSAEYGARLPCIKCLFSCIVPSGGWTSDNYAVGYFCNRGSTGVVAGSVDSNEVRANVGFENFYDNIIANNNSEIVVREAIVRNAGRYGVLSRHISRVSARSADITNCGDIAAYSDRASMMDVRHADLSGSKNAIAAYHASIVTANETDANNIEAIVADAQYGSTINCQGIKAAGAANVFRVTGGANIVATGAVLSNVTGTTYNVAVNTLTANGVIYA